MMQGKHVLFVLNCVLISCLMTACTSLQSQMNSYNSEIRSCAEAENWKQICRIIDNATFECAASEEGIVAEWRAEARVRLKAAFSKRLQKQVDYVRSFYLKGDLLAGDEARLKVKSENVERGIPESLAPCVGLAWVEMMSDGNVARMMMEFKRFQSRLEGTDVNGGRKSIKELDSISQEYVKVNKLQDKIDLFMEKIADPDTRRWTPIDRSAYAIRIKPMETIRDQMLQSYKTKRWNTRVIERQRDYVEVGKLLASKDYYKAMQKLSAHDLLVKPDGLAGAMEFDDAAERAKLASGDLGEQIVKQLFETGLGGVQYSRRTNRGVASVLVIGRAMIDGDKKNKRKLREAGRVAQMRARSEFVKFMNMTISAQSDLVASIEDNESHESFRERTKISAQAEVSNLVVVATGVDKDEVVFVLGWRDPSMGTITPAPMRRVADHDNFIISLSVGAYL